MYTNELICFSWYEVEKYASCEAWEDRVVERKNREEQGNKVGRLCMYERERERIPSQN